jgi:hypothetical protein
MVGRLAAEHGMVVIKSGHAMDVLNSYPAQIHGLGHRAVEARDTDFLYRCLEAIAWIGCAAVRQDDRAVCATCLQALAQLGREARAGQLECFWRNCLLTPFDHADERIGWVASWLHVVPAAQRGAWCALVAEAFARLHGCRYEVSLEKDGEDDRLKITYDPSISHKASIDDNGRLRTIDYSDPAVLKELDLR